MSVASLRAAHEFLTAGARPDAWEWLDEQGRALPSRLPDGVMVRLRRRTDKGFTSVRIAVEDLVDLQEHLPPEVFEC
jgi:hypothetical protein